MTKRTIAGALLLFLVACDGEPEQFPAPSSPTSASPFPSTPTLASPTPPALPQDALPMSGEASETCVEGWVSPRTDSALFKKPLRIIRRSLQLPGEPTVVEMRYFTGPESPPSEKGYLLVVERWYVKLYTEDDLRFQGRFLVESRDFGDGVAAVAPYDTDGFRSPDWSGFQWADTEPSSYPGLPGEWSGTRYDFVEGGGGLDIPGLPAEVTGCLDTA
ncbi:MAG: hypothetical protein K0R20_734 [Actinomycetia bacterium]|jgi:hypothetical protein|nr:hypothetical protein [Actinomycetes bacterium]